MIELAHQEYFLPALNPKTRVTENHREILELTEPVSSLIWSSQQLVAKQLKILAYRCSCISMTRQNPRLVKSKNSKLSKGACHTYPFSLRASILNFLP
jgi:hypothetical protein